jgi:hypothetical protein
MAKRTRSPNYPVLDLEKALGRTKAVYERFKQFPAPIGEVQKLWEYAPGSSIADQTVGALRSYGLIEVTGSGDGRSIRVSDDAKRVLLDATDAPAILRGCAQRPAVNQELLAKGTKDGLPPDAVLRHYLLLDRPETQFSEDVVDKVIERFWATMRFAKLESRDILSEKNEDGPEALDDPNGGSKTPISPQAIVSKLPPMSSGIKQDVFTLDEGQAVLQWPANLSADSFNDLRAWLEIALRKMARAAGVKLDDSRDPRSK